MRTQSAFEIAGTTALVTGAGKRLGRAAALGLASAGADVVVHYRTSADEAERVADEVRRSGREAWTLEADLGDARQAVELVKRARQAAGSVEILVNSASIFPQDEFAAVTADEMQAAMALNALSPFAMMREFATPEAAGAIVNLLDARIVSHDPRHVAYLLSKRALYTLTRMAAIEFAPALRVNAVAPGLVLPPSGEDDTFFQRVAPDENLLGAHGTARDVVEAILFLVRSPFITGQVIYVDGGRNLKENVFG
jgi:NAD(P)-dependent dehydrogenase (short-subunit alcohol dehydrogenase family)